MHVACDFVLLWISPGLDLKRRGAFGVFFVNTRGKTTQSHWSPEPGNQGRFRFLTKEQQGGAYRSAMGSPGQRRGFFMTWKVKREQGRVVLALSKATGLSLAHLKSISLSLLPWRSRGVRTRQKWRSGDFLAWTPCLTWKHMCRSSPRFWAADTVCPGDGARGGKWAQIDA